MSNETIFTDLLHGKAWRLTPAPAKKSEYVGRCLRLGESPEGVRSRFAERTALQLAGAVLYIARRLNAKDTIHTARDIYHWGAVRVLDLEWVCPACGATHREYIPESWREDGQAVFVEREAV